MAVTTVNNQRINNNTKTNSSSNKNSNNTSNFSDYTSKNYSYSDIFSAASKKYNVPQELLEAVALTESSFRANATSYCGAQGIMQLMPATAKSLGVNDAYNPVENIMGGAKYLSQMLKKYNGDTSLALAAYNGGPGNVAKHGGVPSFCKSYVNKVMNYMNKGVNVPNKTVNIKTNSDAGVLMSSYSKNSTPTVNVSNQNKATTKIPTINNNVNSNIDTTIDIDEVNSLSKLYAYAASKYNVPQKVLEALSYAESAFKTDAVSYSGAVGLMQLMPATAKELGVTNAFDPVENVLGGAKYLSQLLKRYNGNTTYAIAAYNAGMGNVSKYNGVPPFAKEFVEKVEKYIKKGVNVPNITIDTTSFLSNKNTNSNRNNNKESNDSKKMLIDIQV